MGNVFAGSEIVEIGIQIEKNGRDFYTTLVNRTKSQKAKEIFGFLAGEEEKHMVTFQGLLESVRKYEPSEAYPGEFFEYMNALASEHIFTKKNQGEAEAKKTASDKDAVNVGMGFEKESILFYEGMRKVVPKADEKTINVLIAQEQIHLRQLYDLKKQLA